MKESNRRRVRAICGVALLVSSFGLAACGGDAAPTSTNNTTAGGSTTSGAPTAANTSSLDAEIERLEADAGKSPADDEVLNALSQGYVRRADARRNAGQLREALRDYQSALRNNPDNEEAQKKVAEISPEIEGGATGENGEPAPLPITPGVTGETGDTDDSSPTPTPAKRKQKQ